VSWTTQAVTDLLTRAGAQELATATMRDTCRVLTWSESTNTYGEPVETFTPGATVACGYHALATSELLRSGDTVIVDARFRLPRTAEGQVTTKDRLQLLTRAGVALSVQPVFRITGNPDVATTALIVEAKEIDV
jgi:head-tail adaptor